MSLKLGVPSKGRLMDKTFDWFAQRGITLSRSGSDREYAGQVDGIDGVSLVLLSAGEIPRELAAGRIHMGVTGQDLIAEKIPAWETQVERLAAPAVQRDPVGSMPVARDAVRKARQVVDQYFIPADVGPTQPVAPNAIAERLGHEDEPVVRRDGHAVGEVEAVE